MLIYHYRPIESAVLEIENGTFHFAAREELNDPLEGYVRVYWQGDKAAWEGLLRNYICSIYRAINMYLFKADEDALLHNTLIVDINSFENVPLGGVYRNLGDMFLEDSYIQQLTDFYGKRKTKVQYEELRLIFQFIHTKAIFLSIKSCVEHGLFPEDEGEKLLQIFEKKEKQVTLEKLSSDFFDEANELSLMKYLQDVFEDMIDYQYIADGLNSKEFLGESTTESDKEKDDIRQHKKWMMITVDFPKIYIEQMKELVYPKGFTVCFSGNNNNSAMWGNYADNHKGVCLIYETDEKQEIRIKLPGGFTSRKVKKVAYGGELIERNFFESFGRLTYSQIKGWLTGTEGISNCYEVFHDEEEWRKKYWDAFEMKNYRKIRDWEYEDEYRIVIDNTFYEFQELESRNLQYDLKSLKGIVFGINTSEYDKMKIMRKLVEKKNVLDDFTFYQAEYDDASQEIKVRKKGFWKL